MYKINYGNQKRAYRFPTTTFYKKKQEVARRIYGGQLPKYLRIRNTTTVNVTIPRGKYGTTWHTSFDVNVVSVIRYYATKEGKDSLNDLDGIPLATPTIDSIVGELLRVFKILCPNLVKAYGKAFNVQKTEL